MKIQNACKLTLLVVAFGFLTTAVEVRYLHRQVVTERWVAWIPTVAAGLATVGAFIALIPGRWTRLTSAGLLGIVAVAGIVGLYFHTGFKPSRFIQMVSAEPAVVKQPDPESFDEFDKAATAEKEDSGPPAFAPLGLTGLGLVGLLMAVASKDASASPKAKPVS
jgi:hypothetical protein